MTIIGEKTADAEIVCGVSSALSSIKNLDNKVIKQNDLPN